MREDGFYWVRDHGSDRWVVAEFENTEHGGYWGLPYTGSDDYRDGDDALAEIDERRIVRET